MKNEYVIKELVELKMYDLIKYYEIEENDSNKLNLTIELLEGKIIKITQTSDNTYKYENKIYESFEQLLTNTSQLYIKKFHELLYQKLNKLQENE